MPDADSSPYNAHLLRREDRHESLAVFHVAFDDRPVPDFQPGQFATLGLPYAPGEEPPSRTGRARKGVRLIRRAYSIASAATRKDAIEFYIVKVDDGLFTPKLWDLEEGDPIFMGDKITGHFTLDGVPDHKHLVFVGTGTGLAPYVSMLRTFGPIPERWDKAVVLDGCRVARDLGYLDELRGLEKADPRFTYLPTVTREPDDSDWAGPRGRVGAWLEPDAFEQAAGFPLDPDTCHVFLCGNPQMIDQVEANLTDRGFVTHDRQHPDGNIHLERYW